MVATMGVDSSKRLLGTVPNTGKLSDDRYLRQTPRPLWGFNGTIHSIIPSGEPAPIRSPC